MGGEPASRAFAVTPALVVEGQHHVAGLVQHPGVVRQVEILDPRVAVAKDDAGTGLAPAEIVGGVEIAGQLNSLAVEGDRGFHAFNSVAPVGGRP